MSDLTAFLKLIKPDKLENFSLSVLNQNMDLIDAAQKNIIVAAPAGKLPKIWIGNVIISKGAGGDGGSEVPLATDANGYGGIFWGQNGVPSFTEVMFITGHTRKLGVPELAYVSRLTFFDINTTRARFRAMREGNNNPANGFANLDLGLLIVGY